MTGAFAGSVTMLELARARARVDAETVAPQRRTPEVPITGRSFDRAAMNDARQARHRLGDQPSASLPPGTPESSWPPDDRPSAAEVGGRTDDDGGPTGVAGAPSPTGGPPLAVVDCVADYSSSGALPPPTDRRRRAVALAKRAAGNHAG